MGNKRGSIFITSLAIFMLGSFLLFGTQAKAAPSGTLVPINFMDNGSDYEYGGGLYSVQTSKTTYSLNVNAPTGKIIKSLKIYDRQGNFLRNVNGDYVGKTSFNGTETFTGTRIAVKSVGNTHGGSIYYWDRHKNSDVWNSSYDGKTLTSSGCALAPSDATGYAAYPNCTSEDFEATRMLQINSFNKLDCP